MPWARRGRSVREVWAPVAPLLLRRVTLHARRRRYHYASQQEETAPQLSFVFAAELLADVPSGLGG